MRESAKVAERAKGQSRLLVAVTGTSGAGERQKVNVMTPQTIDTIVTWLVYAVMAWTVIRVAGGVWYWIKMFASEGKQAKQDWR